MNLRDSSIGATLVALSLWIGPTVANADAAGLSDTVTFHATTTMLTCRSKATEDNDAAFASTCPNPGGNGVPSIGGSGDFAFASAPNAAGVACTLTSDLNDGDNPNPNEGPLPCSVESTGKYESITCGTGEAHGTATLKVDGRTDESTPADGISYNVDFTAGIGVPASIGFDPDPNGNEAVLEDPPGDFANSVTENDSGAASIDPRTSTITLTSTAPGAPGGGVCVTSLSFDATVVINDN